MQAFITFQVYKRMITEMSHVSSVTWQT